MTVGLVEVVAAVDFGVGVVVVVVCGVAGKCMVADSDDRGGCRAGLCAGGSTKLLDF